MNRVVDFPSYNAVQAFFPVSRPISGILASDSVQRIKEIALSVFGKVYQFFSDYDSESAQSNASVKSIGMIGFISLCLILLISHLRNRRFSHGNHDQSIGGMPSSSVSRNISV